MGSSRSGPKTEMAKRAVVAMKPLGFSKDQCHDALRRLFKDYGQNWAIIEDENYRILAEAILDAAQADGDGNPEPEQDEIEAFPAEGYPSTSLAAVATREGFLGPPSPPFPCPTVERHATAMELAVSPRAGSPPQDRASTRALGKRRRRQTIDEYLQPEDTVFLREPKPEPVDMDVSPFQDVQPGLVGSSRHAEASSSRFREMPPPQHDRNPEHIAGARNRTAQRCRNRETTTLPVEPTSSTLNNGTGSGVGNVQEAPGFDIEVASSATGEVKMSLKCSVDPAKFRMPALEAVFKMVEDKCLGSCKVIPLDFSVRSLMTEICQCVLQLGTEHAVEHKTQSDIVGYGSRSEDDRNGKQRAAVESLVSNGSENAPMNSTPAHQQQHMALSTLRINHNIMDISKGEENMRISIVNEFGQEKCPPSFYYIPQNLVFQNAIIDMSHAKIGGEDCCADCFGNCLSAPKPCACAREIGGEYAYTLDGLVRPAFIDDCVSLFPEEHKKVFCGTCPFERSRNKASPEPCRGHLVRKFIKECWNKCGCNMQCGNRVVQRGISCNLQVFFTGEGTGWGLRTLDELPKGTFVCEYAGEILTSTELHERAVEHMQYDRYAHPMPLDAVCCSERVLNDEDGLWLDGTFYGNVSRFINHRCCDANLALIPVEVETPDRRYYHIAFFTSKKVEAFEELTWDYGIDFEYEKQPVKPFECLCGSRYCRGRRRPKKRSMVAAAGAVE